MSEAAWISLGALALAVLVQLLALARWSAKVEAGTVRVEAQGRATREHIDLVMSFVPTKEDLEHARGEIRAQANRITEHDRRIDVVEKRVREAEMHPREATA